MAIQWFSLTVDSLDPGNLARWWAEVLDYEVVWDGDYTAIARDRETFPGVVFVPVDDKKEAKNRLHWDLNPDDQATEVARLEAMGATRVDIGQGDVDWVVMADPEGNEFCLLSPWSPEAGA